MIRDLGKEKQDIKTENQSQIKSKDHQISAAKLELEKVSCSISLLQCIKITCP